MILDTCGGGVTGRVLTALGGVGSSMVNSERLVEDLNDDKEMRYIQ